MPLEMHATYKIEDLYSYLMHARLNVNFEFVWFLAQGDEVTCRTFFTLDLVVCYSSLGILEVGIDDFMCRVKGLC